MKRTRPSTQAESMFAATAVKRSNGWFRKSGIGYEENDYSADGAIFDWAAGRMNVSYSFCAEIWGGPYHDSCFVQFNPPAHRLAEDMAKIRPFYVSIFLDLIQAGPFGKNSPGEHFDPGQRSANDYDCDELYSKRPHSLKKPPLMFLQS